MAVPVQKIVAQLDPDLPVSNVMTSREAIGKSTIDSEFDSILVLAFAMIALVLAAAELYGVLAYLVAQRRGVWHPPGTRRATQRLAKSLVVGRPQTSVGGTLDRLAGERGRSPSHPQHALRNRVARSRGIWRRGWTAFVRGYCGLPRPSLVCFKP